MWFVNVFSLSVVFLFILLTVYLPEQKNLIVTKLNLSIFLLHIVFLVVFLKTLQQTQGHSDLFLYSLLEVLWFYIYI